MSKVEQKSEQSRERPEKKVDPKIKARAELSDDDLKDVDGGCCSGKHLPNV